MTETLQYTDLLTPAELKVDALSSLGIDVTDETNVSGLGGSYKDATIRAIQDVTGSIEEYLDRKLIVRKHNIDIPSFKWANNNALDKQQYYPPQWPVVQVVTSGVDISNDSERFLSTASKSEVEFYAGYKRRDQNVGNDDSDDISNEDGLSGLSETPENLPSDIRRVAVSLVMYELMRAKQGTIAMSSVTKTAGNATAEITKVRQDVYEDELSKLHSHRRIL
ncbi:hypothetical protein [Fodinibius sp. SL11]|uniref:hypothetical protein n=1 Tax=Fodinibius sp. SL11 TaxID=3425690 RepID=UPI003F884A9D